MVNAMTRPHNNMKNVKMSYKGYELSSNPERLEIISRSNINVSPIYDDKGVSENTSICPVVVKGSGYFYGDRAEEECTYLSQLLKDSSAGWLICPALYSIEAYFTEFTYELDAASASASYSFTFVERCDDALVEREVDYVDARENENLFDIANRVGVSVSRLMQLNDLQSPFLINAGERVIVR